jgi:hypothetical protein
MPELLAKGAWGRNKPVVPSTTGVDKTVQVGPLFDNPQFKKGTDIAGSTATLSSGEKYVMKGPSSGATPTSVETGPANDVTSGSTTNQGAGATYNAVQTEPQVTASGNEVKGVENTGMFNADGTANQSYIPQSEEEIMTSGADEYTKANWLANYRNKGTTGDLKFAAQPGSAQAESDLFLQNQAKQKSTLETSVNAQKATQAQQLEQQKAANAAQMAQSREGMMSPDNAIAKGNIDVALQSRYDQNLASLNAQIDELQQLQYENQGKFIAGQESAIQSRLTALENSKAAVLKQEQDKEASTKDYLKMLQDSGGLANLSPGDIKYLEDGMPGAPPGLVQLLVKGATTKAADEKVKNQLDQLNSFADLSSKGVILPMDSIFSFATSTGLDPEMIYNTNQTAAMVMQDKSLSLEEKQTKVADMMYDLSLKQKGILTEAGKKTEELKNLYRNGTDAATISAYKSAAGITDYDDPLTAAKLKYEQANANITQAHSEGKAITLDDNLNLSKTMADLADLGYTIDSSGKVVPAAQAPTGTSQAYVPNAPIAGFTATYENGVLKVTTPPKTGGWQCGEGVNRVWGLASGSEGGMGSQYSSKTGLVDKRGIKSTDITDPASQVVPGMAFVMPMAGAYEWTGHTGLVKQNLGNGQFLTAEWNADGKGGYSEKVRDINQVYGFAYPPEGAATKQAITGGTTEGQLTDAEVFQKYEEAGKLLTTKVDKREALKTYKETGYLPGNKASDYKPQNETETSLLHAVKKIRFSYVGDKDKATADINEYLKEGDVDGAKEALKSYVYNYAPTNDRENIAAKQSLQTQMGKLESQIQEFQKKGGDLGIFTGKTEEALRTVGTTQNPELASIANRISVAIIDYRKAVTGAAFTESEAKAYESLFPSIGKTPALNLQTIQDLKTIAKEQEEGTFKRILGESTYNQLYGNAPAEHDPLSLGVPHPSESDPLGLNS